MKKLTYLIALFAIQLIIGSTAAAQASKDITEVALMKEGNKTIGITLGEGTAKAIQVLGQPNSITDFYSETDDETLKVYNYDSNKLYFSKGVLDFFELKGPGIMIGTVNGDVFRIREKIVTTTKQIPIGPIRDHRFRTETTRTFHNYVLVNNAAGKTRGIANKTISNNFLKKGTNGLDVFIQLLFNSGDALTHVDIIEP